MIVEPVTGIEQFTYTVKRLAVKLLLKLSLLDAACKRGIAWVRYGGKIPLTYYTSRMKFTEESMRPMFIMNSAMQLAEYFGISFEESKVIQLLVAYLRSEIPGYGEYKQIDKIMTAAAHRPLLINAFIHFDGVSLHKRTFLNSRDGDLLEKWVDGERDQVSIKDLKAALNNPQ